MANALLMLRYVTSKNWELSMIKDERKGNHTLTFIGALVFLGFSLFSFPCWWSELTAMCSTRYDLDLSAISHWREVVKYILLTRRNSTFFICCSFFLRRNKAIVQWRISIYVLRNYQRSLWYESALNEYRRFPLSTGGTIPNVIKWVASTTVRLVYLFDLFDLFQLVWLPTTHLCPWTYF